MLGYAPTKTLALVGRFRAASFLRELPFASYKKVIERAEKTAKAFRQNEINMREICFVFRHEDLGTPFKKLAKDYNGEEEFPITAKEFERGYAKMRAGLPLITPENL